MTNSSETIQEKKTAQTTTQPSHVLKKKHCNNHPTTSPMTMKIKKSRHTHFKLSTLIFCRYPSQQSSPVQLVKGKAYYMEALMKEGGGGDHITVGVKLPSGTLQRPISQEDIYITPPPGMMHYSFIQGLDLLATNLIQSQKSNLYFTMHARMLIMSIISGSYQFDKYMMINYRKIQALKAYLK